MAKLDLASSEWCQLIFEGKNQAYGAYRMRANSPRRHTIAMLIVVAIAIVGFTIPTQTAYYCNADCGGDSNRWIYYPYAA